MNFIANFVKNCQKYLEVFKYMLTLRFAWSLLP